MNDKIIVYEGEKPGANRKPGDIGYDCCAIEDTIVTPGLPRTMVRLGHKIALPYGTEEQIRPRSGFSVKGIEGVLLMPKSTNYGKSDKTGHIFLQTEYELGATMRFDADVIIGTVDPDYPDEVCAIVRSLEPRPFLIKKGTRIAQAVYNDVCNPTLTEGKVNKNNYRFGGFGSTGSGEINPYNK